jgi:hypothetical protein
MRLFEKRREVEKQVEVCRVLSSPSSCAIIRSARLLRPDGPPRLFEKRKELMAQFHKVAGSKRNVGRIKEWYEGNKELLGTLDKLRQAGALDVGDV